MISLPIMKELSACHKLYVLITKSFQPDGVYP